MHKFLTFLSLHSLNQQWPLLGHPNLTHWPMEYLCFSRGVLGLGDVVDVLACGVLGDEVDVLAVKALAHEIHVMAY